MAQIRIGNDLFSNQMEAYLFLRNKGLKYVGFTYDISKHSKKHNKNRHPSKYLPTYARAWQDSCWLIPIQMMDRIVELCFSLHEENAQPYMKTKNSGIIILYNECMDDTLSGLAFQKYCEHITAIHTSVVGSIGKLSDKIGTRLDNMEKDYDELTEEQRKRITLFTYRQMRQIFSIASKRIKTAVTNSQLWEDSGRLIDLINAKKDLIQAEKLANTINREYANLFADAFPDGI